jgi:hypothetical protein
LTRDTASESTTMQNSICGSFMFRSRRAEHGAVKSPANTGESDGRALCALAPHFAELRSAKFCADV